MLPISNRAVEMTALGTNWTSGDVRSPVAMGPEAHMHGNSRNGRYGTSAGARLILA
jgi:hypothetical protein